ncbi:MAG: polysaccharide deacetylase family protein, partial [Cyanothece sp. SIO1E1]|nr:polysaccharide deacetylase family protein [Cyanothece sp. SIO1E1]
SVGDKDYHWELKDARSYTQEQYDEDKKTRPWQSMPGTRYGFFFQVWEAVHLAHPDLQHDLMCQILDWAGVESHALDDPYRPMTLKELATVETDSQIEVGGHTKNHTNLASQSLEDQWREIRESKEDLEEILGHSVDGFAYPYGKYSPETVDIVGHAGFEYACTVHPGSVWQDSQSLLLPRWEVTDCDGEEFEQRLKGWLTQ